jgi:phosphoglycerate dehydrogenase-like enzyme
MAAGKRVVVIAYPFLDGRGALAGKLDAAIVARLRAIDPDAEIVYAPLGSNDRLYGAMKSAPPEILDSLITEFPAEYLEALPRAEVLHCLYVPVDVLKRAPHLRWISNIGSGTDQYTQTGVLGSQVVLTSAKGVAASSIAEFAMSQLLVLTKGTIERLDNQRSRRWAKVRKRDLRGMSLGVIGLGEIGKHATRLAKAF